MGGRPPPAARRGFARGPRHRLATALPMPASSHGTQKPEEIRACNRESANLAGWRAGDNLRPRIRRPIRGKAFQP